MIEKTDKLCAAERTVIGFDIRKSSSLKNLFMTSYDNDVRYENIYENSREYRSGINLFFVDPSSISSLEFPLGARIIAFDLPTDLVVRLLRGNVSRPQPLPEIDMREGWDFVGFDVVDPMTQTSAIYGFSLRFSKENLIEDNHLILNSYGLIEDIRSAEKMAQLFDDLIPEHAPHSPLVVCGSNILLSVNDFFFDYI